MDRPYGGRLSVDQTAWTVLVVRVVFNDFSVEDGLSQLKHADASDDALIDRMLRKLETVCGDLFTNLAYRGHTFMTTRQAMWFPGMSLSDPASAPHKC
jgi:hypothetical protein